MKSELRMHREEENWATLLQNKNSYKWFGLQGMPSPLDLPTVKKGKAGAC